MVVTWIPALKPRKVNKVLQSICIAVGIPSMVVTWALFLKPRVAQTFEAVPLG